MNVKVNGIYGFDDTFVAMYISKRSLTDELEQEIRDTCDAVLTARGRIRKDADPEDLAKFNKWLGMALRMGKRHITILRFIMISLMTKRMHRAGQDDIDSHSPRMNNRIIRSSTRLATFNEDELSDFYQDKVIPLGMALKILDKDIPDSFDFNGETYIRSANGYIKKEYEGNKDVMRGLYPLGIPSDFVCQICLTEWAHVFKERNSEGGANPEVKEWAESVQAQLTEMHDQITRELVKEIQN